MRAGLLAVCLFAACAAGDDREPLVVFAASSLADAFEELERSFERAHPDVDLRLVFAGSQVLRLQIEHGAEAHVFASADASHTDALTREGLLVGSEVFAENELVIITPVGESSVHDLHSLEGAARLVIGAESSPIGAYTRQLFDNVARAFGPEHAARLRANVVSQESNARLVRTKVELGEADAAIVYRTDARLSASVRAVPLPAALNVRARYRVGLVRTAPPVAEAFLRLLRSAEGRSLLERHGFLTEAL